MAQTLNTPRPDSPTSQRENDPFQGLVLLKSELTMTGSVAIHIQPDSKALSWCIQPEGGSLIETLQTIRDQDHIMITTPSGETIFEGVLKPRFHILDPIKVYQDVNGERSPPAGFLIYWTPEGIDPYTWLSWFSGGNKVIARRQLRALVPRASDTD